ncbi:MAG: peptidylprolyl isomerase [Chloroflexi bacterium]|nr:peptidylprolyl isomerase [Chloroflexota bacterium]
MKKIFITTVVVIAALLLMIFAVSCVKGSLDQLDKEVIVIETNMGNMIIGLFPNAAPKHVAQFKKLTEEGFFNGDRFHRVIAGFMIQTGDPLSRDASKKPYWGTGGAENNIPAEFNSLIFVKGAVGAARSQDPNSASSQFFICVADAQFLNNNYTVFGKVLQGQEVADEISKLPRNERDVPNKDVIIQKMYLAPNTSK